MNICPDCAKEIESDSRFCPHCGVIFFTKSAQKSDPVKELSSETDPSSKEEEPESPGGPSDAKSPRKKCPECGNRVEPGALACKVCGLIFYSKPAKPVYETPRQPVPPKPSSISPIAFALLTAFLVLLIYYIPKIRWVFAGNVNLEPRAVQALPSDWTEFDLEIELQGQPSGLACNGQECIMGHPDAGTFIRISQTGDRYMARQQRVGDMSPLAWNGKEYIAFAESGFFESFREYSFTKHDPSTLNTHGRHSAPGRIGGVAWDGSGYWAASRLKSVEDRGFIYRLNQDLKVVNKLVAPSSGCAGLAWDGSHLWFLDDRERTVHILDVKGIQARSVGSYRIPLRTASGIAFDGRRVWIADRDQSRLLRLDSELSAKWVPRTGPASTVMTATQKGPLNFDEFRMDRPSSESDVHVQTFSAKVESNTVYASWDIRFGQKLLQVSNRTGQPPLTGKLTITVDGGNLSAPVARVYDANEARNFADREPLVSDIGPGSYQVRLFIYHEYTDSDGRGRIFTRSIPPLNVIN